MLPHHGQFYLSEVSTAMFCFLGLILLDHSRKIAFVLLLLGIANNPVILPLLLVCLVERRWRPVIILILISVVLWVAFENWVKFGSLLGSPYFSEGEKGYKTIMPYSGLAGFSYPMVLGVLSIVASFGKGLIFFIPSLILSLHSRMASWLKFTPANMILINAAIILLVLLYAKWWAWYGGVFWGPRFFLILVFPSCLFLAILIRNFVSLGDFVVCVVLVSMSFWVGFNGVHFGQDNLGICFGDNYAMEMLCWYVPEFSALWRPFVVKGWVEVVREVLVGKRALFGWWQVIGVMVLQGVMFVRFIRLIRSRSIHGLFQRSVPSSRLIGG